VVDGRQVVVGPGVILVHADGAFEVGTGGVEIARLQKNDAQKIGDLGILGILLHGLEEGVDGLVVLLESDLDLGLFQLRRLFGGGGRLRGQVAGGDEQRHDEGQETNSVSGHGKPPDAGIVPIIRRGPAMFTLKRRRRRTQRREHGARESASIPSAWRRRSTRPARGGVPDSEQEAKR